MPINFDLIGDAKKLALHKAVLSSLIQDYALEEHLPRDFNLTIEILDEASRDIESIAPLETDLSARKIVVYARNFSDKVAFEDTVRASVEAETAAKKNSSKYRRDVSFKVEEKLSLERQKIIKQNMEPRFREAVMGPFLLHILTPAERQSLIKTVEHEKSLGAHYLAQKEIHAAVARLLPYPPESSANACVAQIQNMGAPIDEKLQQLIKVCGTSWFANKSKKLEKLPAARQEVEKNVRTSLKSQLRMQQPSESSLREVDPNLREKALKLDHSQWIHAQTVDGNYEGPIVLDEGKFFTQIAHGYGSDGRLQLVLHKKDAFPSEDVSFASKLVPMTFSYVDAKVYCKPALQAFKSSEEILKKEHLKLRLSSPMAHESGPLFIESLPPAVNRIKFDPSSFVLAEEDFFCVATLHWLRHNSQGYTIQAWEQTPLTLREQLLERREISPVDQDAVRRILAATSTVPQELSIDDILLRITKTQEVDARTKIDAQAQQELAVAESDSRFAIGLDEVQEKNDLQGRLAQLEEAVHRDEVKKQEQTVFQELDFHELFTRWNAHEQVRYGEQNVRAGIERAQVREMLGLRRAVTMSEERAQCTDIQRQEQVAFQELARSEVLSQERSVRARVERVQAQELLDLQLLATQSAQTQQRVGIQRLEHAESQAIVDFAAEEKESRVFFLLERESRTALENSQQSQRREIVLEARSEFLEVRDRAQTEYFQQETAELSRRHNLLSVQEMLLAKQQQALKLQVAELVEGQARLQIECAEQEAFPKWNKPAQTQVSGHQKNHVSPESSSRFSIETAWPMEPRIHRPSSPRQDVFGFSGHLLFNAAGTNVSMVSNLQELTAEGRQAESFGQPGRTLERSVSHPASAFMSRQTPAAGTRPRSSEYRKNLFELSSARGPAR